MAFGYKNNYFFFPFQLYAYFLCLIALVNSTCRKLLNRNGPSKHPCYSLNYEGGGTMILSLDFVIDVIYQVEVTKILSKIFANRISNY